MSDWEEQYRRIERGLARIKNQNRPREEYEDDLWCFFINCWALKDWLKEDVSLDAHTRVDITKEAHRSPILQYCRTVGDKRKHLHLDQPHKPAQAIGAINLSMPEETVTVSWYIKQEAEAKVPVVEFAESVVSEWKRILREHDLL